MGFQLHSNFTVFPNSHLPSSTSNPSSIRRSRVLLKRVKRHDTSNCPFERPNIFVGRNRQPLSAECPLIAPVPRFRNKACLLKITFRQSFYAKRSPDMDSATIRLPPRLTDKPVISLLNWLFLTESLRSAGTMQPSLPCGPRL